MSEMPEPMAVESEDEYVHVRYRDPDEFETIRTPEWADNALDSVVEDSEVRMGKRAGSDEADPQSVLVPEPVEENEARQRADEILQKIERSANSVIPIFFSTDARSAPLHDQRSISPAADGGFSGKPLHHLLGTDSSRATVGLGPY